MLTLSLINESLITCQSINSNYTLFVFSSLEQFHNISDNGCRHVLYKESENSSPENFTYIFFVNLILTFTNEPLITCQSII
jgi:hypothetical protein